MTGSDPLIGDVALAGLFPTRPARAEVPVAVPWYSEYANVVRLARWLADDAATVETIIYMLEKPWKFTGDWQTMLAAGK